MTTETSARLLSPSKGIKLTGTEQPDLIGQILIAGPMSVEFDNGNLRYLRFNGTEVLRAIGFLVRDENWGTYTPTLENLKIDQREDTFTVSYQASCSRADQQIDYDARIEGQCDGGLLFHVLATPKTNFATARTGFVVLHPLSGVVGGALKVDHVDGTVTSGRFEEHVNPDCPVRNIRALTHEVLPNFWARCEMLGDAYEMEDHRNWSDASFKTYVRPLSKPWPYTLPAAEVVQQSVSLKFAGAIPKARSRVRHAPAVVKINISTKKSDPMPPIGLGVPAEELDSALSKIHLLKKLAPKLLVCFFDIRLGHGIEQLLKYRYLSEQTGAVVSLELVVQSLENYVVELESVAKDVRLAGLKLASVVVCPVGHLKSVLPGGTYPPTPELAALYLAARAAFPGTQLGGGMFSFFTEINRKRPPAHLLDFISNTTCPIVHAADDRSVMETLEALPWQIETARSFSGGAAHHIGPSGIGARENPHGATFSENPANSRVCLAKMDPRQRGLFSAAWTLGYVSALVRSGVRSISMAAPTGPLGLIYRKTENSQPFFDMLQPGLAKNAVYPVYHVIAALNCAAGAALLTSACSDERAVACLAWQDGVEKFVLVANLSAEEQLVALSGLGPCVSVGVLDESSFVSATTQPTAFRRSSHWLPGTRQLRLGGYAVACLHEGA